MFGELREEHLQRIAEALKAYAADHGTYPPPTVYDSAGKPMREDIMVVANVREFLLDGAKGFVAKNQPKG